MGGNNKMQGDNKQPFWLFLPNYCVVFHYYPCIFSFYDVHF